MAGDVKRVRDALALLMEMDPDAPLVIDQGDSHEPVTGLTVGWVVGDPGGRFAVLEEEPTPDEVAFLAAEGVASSDLIGRCVVVQ